MLDGTKEPKRDSVTKINRNFRQPFYVYFQVICRHLQSSLNELTNSFRLL